MITASKNKIQEEKNNATVYYSSEYIIWEK